LKKNAKKFSSEHFLFAYHFFDSLEVTPVISKRFGNAVKRNYARRIIKENFRVNFTEKILSCLVFVKVYPSFLDAQKEILAFIKYLEKKTLKDQ